MGVYMFYFMFAAILSSRQKYVTLNPHLVCLCNLPLFCFHHPVCSHPLSMSMSSPPSSTPSSVPIFLTFSGFCRFSK